MAKHRSKHRSKRVGGFAKKASIAGSAVMTATALTLSIAPPAAAAVVDDQSDASDVMLAALSIPDIPGVNVITTGPPFGLLGIVGLNPFWVPALPSRIADEINGTSYLGGADLDIPVPVPNPLYDPNCHRADCPPETITGHLDLDLVSLRVPLVLAFGIGSLAAGMAYPQVEADLPNQPGGTAGPPGSSVTIVPMLLLRNPGRNDGGIAARFAPLFAPFGFDTATNDFDVQTDGTAVLVPIKVDATVQNDPLSDFAAWPNPVTLLNNAAAFAFPTYILRGTDVSSIGVQTLNPLVSSLVGNFGSAIIGDGLTVDLPGALPSIDLSRAAAILALDPVLTNLLGDTFPGIDIEIPNGPELADRYEALNLYLTLENSAQPMLEPFRLPFDFLSLVTGQTITNPFADAVEPAIAMLGNLGYTNVVQYGADPNDFRDDYQRDFSDNFGSNGGEAMPFFSFPQNIDWAKVPEDFAIALSGGIQDAFFYGGIPGLNNPPPTYQNNPLGLVADLIEQLIGPISLSSITELGTLDDAGDVLAAIDAAGGSAGLRDLGSATPLAATAVPDQNAEGVTVSADVPPVSSSPPQGGATVDGALAQIPAISVAEDITDTPFPRFPFGRGGMESSTSDESSPNTGSSGTRSIRRAISDTRQQIRGSVRDFTRGVRDTAGDITKAATGRETRNGDNASDDDSSE